MLRPRRVCYMLIRKKSDLRFSDGLLENLYIYIYFCMWSVIFCAMLQRVTSLDTLALSLPIKKQEVGWLYKHYLNGPWKHKHIFLAEGFQFHVSAVYCFTKSVKFLCQLRNYIYLFFCCIYANIYFLLNRLSF